MIIKPTSTIHFANPDQNEFVLSNTVFQERLPPHIFDVATD
jgi:hypothetical protein